MHFSANIRVKHRITDHYFDGGCFRSFFKKENGTILLGAAKTKEKEGKF